MKTRQKRIALIAGGLAAIGVATALVMNALNSNLAFFITPTEVLDGKAPQDKAFRIGGLVKEGSIRRDNLTVHFLITDTAKDVPVTYTGILPDLFKEGKGAVAQGRIKPDGSFEDANDSNPMRRVGRMPELQNLATFLMADGCEWLSGETIAVDGAGYLANGASFTELDKLSDADWERMRAMIKAQNDKDRAGRSA